LRARTCTSQLLKWSEEFSRNTWMFLIAVHGKVTTEKRKDPFLFLMSMFRVLRCYCVGITNPDKDGRLQEISNFWTWVISILTLEGRFKKKNDALVICFSFWLYG